ncbi:DUF2811 domain-containing protein [Prochlorococcus marinus]|uniref:DUF2811 domain-containing protein n=1 Tax=Prochlorococcus marinus TaxID=1219 RepID=UPI0022B2EE1A|nr:DUF2811 domain-containing protein [Prochlorococcus marinus]
MDLAQLKISEEKNENIDISKVNEAYVSLETEIPEVLYRGMKEFIYTNPKWDQYSLMSSALANFLFQNGSEDRAVAERYLNDLFVISNS